MTMFVCTLARSTRSPGSRARPSASAGVRVILREPVHHPLERDDPGGRDDSGLAHAAAEHLPHTRAPGDERGRAADDRADGRGEPFDAERDGVDVTGELARRALEGDRRVEEPRAVEVDRDRRAWAVAATALISSGVQQVPPWRLCARRRRGRSGMWMFAGRSASLTWSGVRNRAPS